jgi:glycerophosphoryl diester phosphodiesterase
MKGWGRILVLIALTACTKEYRGLDVDVFAHAGESLYPTRNKYPPNSIKGIEYSLTDVKTDGVEVDVQMTSDGVLLAYHDEMLSENTDNDGCINSKLQSELTETKIYKSDEVIPTLASVFELVLPLNKKIMLDVKHWNACTDGLIDFQMFNTALSDLTNSYSPAQRNLIIVNARNLELLNTINTPDIVKSLETEDVDVGLEAVQNNGVDMLTIKLEAMNAANNDMLKDNSVLFGIFNLKTKQEIKSALDFSPTFVISDKIEYTIKLING